MQQDFVKVIRGSECIAWPDLVPPPCSRYELVSFKPSFGFLRQRPLSDLVRETRFYPIAHAFKLSKLGHLEGCQFLDDVAAVISDGNCFHPRSFVNKFLRTLRWTMDKWSVYQRKLQRRGLIFQIGLLFDLPLPWNRYLLSSNRISKITCSTLELVNNVKE